MQHRTITISWLPRTQAEWRTFTAARQEAAAVWNWLVEAHAAVRETSEPWPSYSRLAKEGKRRFPNLLAQSVQQTVADFCDAVTATTAARKKGCDTNYPCATPKYRGVIFPNQAVQLRDGILTLPCAKAGKLHVRIPDGVTLPGRLMEVRLHFGEVQIVCEVPDTVHPPGPTIGVDLGVNTLVAATDGKRAVLVSGRAVKSLVRLRNKRLAEISAKLSKKTKGSKRHRKLQRRKYKMLDRSKRCVRDLCHKATRKIADAFPGATAFVGEPFNDAARKLGRVQAQQVSSACGAILIMMLAYKLASAMKTNESYSSQTCPVCAERNKCRRLYRCACGCTAPRDVIGATNIRSIGLDGSMVPGRSVPNAVHFVQPHKYAGSRRLVASDTAHVARSNPRSPRLQA